MTTAITSDRLITARSEVKRACDLLISPTPEALDGCQAALQRAASALREWHTSKDGSKTQAHDLQREVRRANRLLEGLATFYRGWERILGAFSGGYIAGGEPAPVERSSRICCRG